MNRELMKSIDRWLVTATKGELLARRDHAYELRRELKDPLMQVACNDFIRAIDKEIVARAELFEFVQRTEKKLKAVT